MTTATKPNYKDTLNLPKTDFPMKASLVQNEPARLAKWRAGNLYARVLDRHAADPTFILHDGPPFANGDIHMGHVINKVLKDVILRFKAMQGHRTPYVPGWDCHGLPIEHKIQQDLGPKLREMSVVDVRGKCHAYAEKFVGVQSEQFQRLGILGDWANPYKTMAPKYEAASLEVFARFVEHGLVYKQLKPVHWSIANQTALAEAELEYKDVDDTSVFVEFPAANPGLVKGRFGLAVDSTVSFMIWTTTPWTLPANLAVAINPGVDYAFVQYERAGQTRVSVVATDLLEKVFNGRVENRDVLATVKGSELVDLEYRHPFINRVGKLLPAEYVTTTDGTGLVHTAPGHGDEDYGLGRQFGLEIYCPVQANGRFDSTVPPFLAGLTVWESNPVVVEKLNEVDVLFAEQKIHHSYPHDWRSKTKTIFRATEQWFISLDKPFAVEGDEKTLRQRAMAAIDRTAFVPAWGKARLVGMVDSRPDWCVSRQRAWGLPIPVFYNPAGEPLLTPASVRAVAATFAERGSDAWFTLEPKELLGMGFDFPAGFSPDSLRKEADIFDVWFESGSSWNAVLNARADLPDAPADLYLEGSDQHRGWFQLSLLSSLGATGKPPFKELLTHGFIVKPDGTKVSKSDKEYVTATQEIDRHGADLLRLWCASVDYQGDVPVSPKALQEFGDKYRKIRNTLRFLISNLYDFDPTTDSQDIQPDSLDGWMASALDDLIKNVTRELDAYATHRAFRLLHDFCAVEVSSVYGNAMKDRLYCDSADSPRRRTSQTVMHRAAVALTKLLAPMLVFTADEAWEHLSHKPAGEEDLQSVHEASLPTPFGAAKSDAWPQVMELRDSALLQLDRLKKEVGLNKSTDSEIVYHVDAKTRAILEPFGEDLADLAAAGGYSFVEKGGPPTVEVIDRRGDYEACARSWKRRPDVGADPEHPDLSARDAAAVESLS